MAKKEEATVGFETKLQSAKETLEILMNQDITLEESVKAYEKGMKELQDAQKMLQDAQIKIQEIKASS
ncbi:MAG: exodeoxyribonuclease VII small subunit [Sulfurimonas sp.]|nr:exodeoxyribonuclease VII small subunit [Sulfurimonas sp.]